MKKRFLAMLLTLAMVLSLCPMTVFAAEGGEMHTETEVYINPMYADIITEDSFQGNPVMTLDEDAVIYDTIAEAADFMRQSMKAREPYIGITLRCQNVDFNHSDIYDAAVAHTGVPTEGDYLKWHFGGYQVHIGSYHDGEDYYVSFVYDMLYLSTAEQERAVNTIVGSIVSDLAGLSDYEQVCGIYDALMDVTYDYQNGPEAHSAYGALVKAHCVCQGYASAFYRLALELDLDSRVISGIGNGGAHGWNIVKLGNRYYNVDATWDAIYVQAGYEYNWFLKSESNFADHIRDAEYKTSSFHASYPMANADFDPNSVQKLAITAHPQSVTAKLNDTVQFSVAATGEGLTYQWQWRKNGSSSWAATTAAGNQTASINVSATEARNGYQYRCVIKDTYGKQVTSNSATLKVTATLAIKTQPANVTAKVNDTVKFTVSASGMGLKYQWQYRTSSTGTWTNTTLTGYKTNTLTVSATKARNGYQYRCVITDADGNKVTSNGASLKVTETLAIKSQPASVTAKVNDTVKFTVSASGMGLKYQWQYRTSSTGTWTNTTLTGYKTNTLTVSATKARNGYQYRCVITDADGNKVTSNGASLKVTETLAIKSQPASVTAKVNDTVKFTVSASGMGLKYQWQYRTSSTGTWTNATLTGYKTNTLTVSATKARNGYQYRCVITDADGNKVTSNGASLKVTETLAIKSQPASVTAKVNDTVKFTVSASGMGLKYQWQWRKNASSNWAATTVTGNKTATISVAATAARNGYQYRCVITDADGNKVTSNSATLTVKQNLAITSQPKSVTAKLYDTVKFAVSASGTGLKYQWQWRKNASSDWVATTVTGNKTATISVAATAARNGYQYRCVITDADGKQVTSNAVTLMVQ